MKTTFKSALTIMLGIIFSGSIMMAQEQTQSNQPAPSENVMKPILTEAQKAMLKDSQGKRKESRAAFKATLTLEQKEMLIDPRMVKADRLKAFRASLTDQQVNIIKARQQEIKASKSQFWSTLSVQQKMKLRKMAANRSRMNWAIF
jgi:hypothetical protein